ncbi:MBL fold metallo-hydrolase [Amaricoccus sp.]|uniref:MBL fold metallo-hydrolase n=1 Tax=Amaricoccus sp. TaxID=1872485 RepID=UPI002608653C|nr:MBL fold metallo-hydrolase [Amaricoccus sp.]HRO13026.1 MBL fold metallo-hydrolase [Amaricoccus sp.]
MTARLTVRILGCGSSAGVPRIGGEWGACDPTNPKNRRSRCSIILTRTAAAGTTRVLVDTSPDLRSQLLDAGVGLLDGVAYTHPHADHIHGIDDLRTVVQNRRARLPVWADADTAELLMSRFAYVFVQPEGSLYPPILELRPIDGPFVVDGAGGPISFRPFRVEHGRIDALGFRVNDFAYLPDVSAIPDPAWAELEGLDTFVLDALRRKPHPTHSHLAQSLEWIARLAPRVGVLTNMHNDLDHATLLAELPPGVIPAHDGLELEIPA